MHTLFCALKTDLAHPASSVASINTSDGMNAGLVQSVLSSWLVRWGKFYCGSPWWPPQPLFSSRFGSLRLFSDEH